MSDSDQTRTVRTKFKTYSHVIDIADSLVDRLPDIRGLRKSHAIIFKCAIFSLRTISREKFGEIYERLSRLHEEDEASDTIEVFVNRSYILTLKDILGKIEREYGKQLTSNEGYIIALLNLHDIEDDEFSFLIKGVKLSDLEERYS